MAMRFNLHSINGGLKEAAPIRERAVRAEQLGFEGVFLGASQLSTLDPFQVLATCAIKTEKLRLGVNIDHVATIRNARGGAHPDPLRAARTAQAAVRLDAMSTPVLIAPIVVSR